MKSHFFAYLLRMKNIKRWGLMRNHIEENVKEHSLDVAYIAHGIALIGNVYYHKNYNQEHIAVLAMFHDASEVITGDLATPIQVTLILPSRRLTRKLNILLLKSWLQCCRKNFRITIKV